MKQQTHKHVTFSDYKNFKTNEFVDDLKMQIDITETNFDNSELEIRWHKFKTAFHKICNKHV